jgi:hypothetical protein
MIYYKLTIVVLLVSLIVITSFYIMKSKDNTSRENHDNTSIENHDNTSIENHIFMTCPIIKSNHYRCIFVIIDDDSNPEFFKFREVWNVYMHDFPDVLCVFARFSPEQILPIQFVDNVISFKGSESIGGVLFKSIKSVEFILSCFSFDYIIRTNISTFWDIQKLFTNVLDSWPTYGVFGGKVIRNSFVSGTGIIMSRDVAEYLTKRYRENPIDTVSDDLEIGNYITNKFTTRTTEWALLTEGDLATDKQVQENHQFRIKSDDRGLDIKVVQDLLFRIYGKQVKK